MYQCNPLSDHPPPSLFVSATGRQFNVTFERNSAPFGGGVMAVGDSVVSGCLFQGNRADTAGGAMGVVGLECRTAHLSLTSTVFLNNKVRACVCIVGCV